MSACIRQPAQSCLQTDTSTADDARAPLLSLFINAKSHHPLQKALVDELKQRHKNIKIAL